jgi:transcriptional regulator with XRE-family HTH domain
LKLARTREWRESHGLTQRELAAEAGVGEVTVARIETGASVTPPTARKIAQALGVRVADLLERPPVPLAEASQETGRPEIRAGRGDEPEEVPAPTYIRHNVLDRDVLERVARGELTVDEAMSLRETPSPRPAAAHDEVVAMFPYSPETQAEAFEGALRAAARARSEYDAVLSGEPRRRLVVRDDGERIELAIESSSTDPSEAKQRESLRRSF